MGPFKVNIHGQRPKHLKFWEHRPIMFESGRLYFELEMWNGRYLYASVKGKNVGYWLNKLLNLTDAGLVTHLSGGST